jgi:hypothetical protein
MTKKKKVTAISLSIALLVGGLWYYNHDYTGSRSGRVVDAVTGEPIEGAVVCMHWNTGGFFTVAGGVRAAGYETRTDAKGRYYVPNQRLRRFFWFESVGQEVLVYRSGYCGYKVYRNEAAGYSFGKASENQPYRPKRNLVRLFPFRQSDDHRKHLQWIETFGGVWEHISLLEEELQKERDLVNSSVMH